MICKWLGDRLVPGNLLTEAPSLTITRQPQSSKTETEVAETSAGLLRQLWRS